MTPRLLVGVHSDIRLGGFPPGTGLLIGGDALLAGLCPPYLLGAPATHAFAAYGVPRPGGGEWVTRLDAEPPAARPRFWVRPTLPTAVWEVPLSDADLVSAIDALRAQEGTPYSMCEVLAQPVDGRVDVPGEDMCVNLVLHLLIPSDGAVGEIARGFMKNAQDHHPERWCRSLQAAEAAHFLKRVDVARLGE